MTNNIVWPYTMFKAASCREILCSVFALVVQGWRGHLKTHEEYMYILDFVPIYLVRPMRLHSDFLLFCMHHVLFEVLPNPLWYPVADYGRMYG